MRFRGDYFLLCFLFLLILVPLTSAEDYYGVIGDDITVAYSCINQTSGNACPDGTQCNVTLKNIVGNTVGLSNGTSSDGYISVFFNGGNFTSIGTYDAEAYCVTGSESTTGSKSIKIGNIGFEQNSLEYVYKVGVYLITFSFLILMFLLLVFLYFKIPKKNQSEQSSELSSIAREKGMLKVASRMMFYEFHTLLLFGMYLIIFTLSYIGYGMALEFNMEIPTAVFNIISTILGISMLPVFIGLFVYTFIKVSPMFMKMLDIREFGGALNG